MFRFHSPSVILMLFTVGWGAQPVTQGRSLQARVQELLKQAQGQTQKTNADRLFESAERVVLAWTPLSQQDRSFMRNAILRERAKKTLSYWKNDRGNTALLLEARQQLDDVIRGYHLVYQYCQAQSGRVEALNAPGRSLEDKEQREIRSAITRAEYELAWTHYWRGMMSEGPPRDTHLKKASGYFSLITSHGYCDNNPFVADCFYGHALCLYQLGRYRQVVDELLDTDIIKPNNTPTLKFKQITVVRVRCSREIHPTDADRAASQYFHNLCRRNRVDPRAPFEKLRIAELCRNQDLDSTDLTIALEWARSLADITQLRNTRMRTSAQARLDDVCTMIESHGAIWQTRLAGILTEKDLYTRLEPKTKALTLFQAQDYEGAIAAAEVGLQSGMDTTPTPSLSADLAAIRIAAYWNLERWRQAHLAACDFLRDHRQHHRSVEVCAQAVQSGLKALTSMPALSVNTFLDQVAEWEEHFKGHPDVQQTRRRAARILAADQRSSQALTILKTIPPNHVSYAQAQWDLAEILYRKLHQERKHSAASETEWMMAADALLLYLDTTADPTPALSAALDPCTVESLGSAIVLGLLECETPATAKARALLDGLGILPGALSGPLFQALDLYTCVLERDIDRAQPIAEAIQISDSSGAGVLLRAVNALAMIDIVPGAERPEDGFRMLVTLSEKLLSYQRLHPDLGSVQQVSALRFMLADAWLRQKRYAPAHDQYRWLVDQQASTEVGAAQRGLALCLVEMGDHQQALPYWERLYRGLPMGGQAWFEASYYVILCRMKTGDGATARLCLDAFRIETEQMDLGPWQARFETLQGDLSPIP